MKKIGKYILGIVFLCSCSQQNTVELENYEVKNLQIKEHEMTEYFDSTNCNIEIATELTLPSNTKYISGEKIIYENNMYYIIDTKYNHCIFIFDSCGNYVAKLGGRGRAKNEFIQSPTDFFIGKNGDVHIFEKSSRRVIIFTKDGDYKKTIKFDIWPYSIGYTSNGNYLAAFNYKEAGYGFQLAVFSPNEEIISPILDLKSDCNFVSNNKTSTLYNNYLYHIPNLSDSVLVFSGDTVKEVIKIKFTKPFLSDDIKEKVAKSDMKDYISFRGISSINDYYETKNFIHFSYSLSHVKLRCLIDKNSGKQYNTTGSFYKGLFPGNTYCIKDDCILWLITQEDIDDLFDIINSNLSNENSLWSETHFLIKDIIKYKYKLPLILKIKPLYD